MSCLPILKVNSPNVPSYEDISVTLATSHRMAFYHPTICTKCELDTNSDNQDSKTSSCCHGDNVSLATSHR